MELFLIIILVLMILGSIYSLNATDLLSAVISYGVVGFGLVIAFLLLHAPDLAIVPVVVEVVTLIIMIAAIKITERKTKKIEFTPKIVTYYAVTILAALIFVIIFDKATGSLSPFGVDTMRMSKHYIDGVAQTQSANLVTGVVFDFRAYDTLGEATVLFTAVIGVLTILRMKGKKKK
jgi:multicomponent Na+:H+ antiporter subunit B